MTRAIRVAMACLVVVLLFGVVQARAAAILHYHDDTFVGAGDRVRQVLATLGETATATVPATFGADLVAQSWDLVIVDVSNNTITAANRDALIGYINGGGSALMSYFNLETDATLAAAFDVSVASSFDAVQDVFSWDTTHPIFNNVNAISSPIAFTEVIFGDDGDELNAGGIAIAGFTASPAAGKAAIVIGNGGRTIVNGWLFDELSDSNGINLAANEINFLLNGSANAVPEPSTLALWGIGALGLVIGAARRRRS